MRCNRRKVSNLFMCTGVVSGLTCKRHSPASHTWLGLIFVLMLYLTFAASAEASCSGSGLSWTCSAGSTWSDIQGAYNSGTDGMTITLAAGNYDWQNNRFTIHN